MSFFTFSIIEVNVVSGILQPISPNEPCLPAPMSFLSYNLCSLRQHRISLQKGLLPGVYSKSRWTSVNYTIFIVLELSFSIFL